MNGTFLMMETIETTKKKRGKQESYGGPAAHLR